MVYEHYLRCFTLHDPSLGPKISKLFEIVTIVTHGDILRLVALVLGVRRLLAMVKDIGGLHPIVIGEVFF
jgi:hypothetical protein